MSSAFPGAISPLVSSLNLSFVSKTTAYLKYATFIAILES